MTGDKVALYAAVRFLASRCDGANAQDGQGFNAHDAARGREFAETPLEAWPDAWVPVISRMLRKYRRQLRDGGMDVDEFIQLQAATQQADRTLEVEGSKLVLRSPYDKELVKAIKKLPAKRFRQADKAWEFPMACRPGLLRIADEFEIPVAPGVSDPTMTTSKKATKQLRKSGAVVVDLIGGQIEIDAVEASPEEVSEIRFLRGSRFDPERRRWQVGVHLIRIVRELAASYSWIMSPALDRVDDIDPTLQPVTLRAENTLLVVSFPYDQEMTKMMRGLEGARWDQGRHGWTVPIESGFDLLAALESLKDIDLSDHAGELLAETRRMMARIGESRALDAELDVPGMALDLRPFQRAGVRYAAEARRCVIGDEMGLGKTPQALATLQLTNAWPTIGLVPSQVKVNWLREAAKFLPHLRTGALYGMPPRKLADQVAEWIRRGEAPFEDGLLLRYPVQPGVGVKIELRKPTDVMNVYRLITQLDLIIVNYDIVGPTVQSDKERKANRTPDAGWTPVLQALEARGAFADESQVIKTATTLRARGAVEVARSLEDDPVILALSGSAILNRRGEMASQLDFIGRLPEFGGADAVRKMPDMARRLRARCMVRRKKADVAPELPAREHAVVVLGREDLDPGTMREYDKAERDLLKFLADRARKIAAELGEDPESAAVQARLRAQGSQYLIRINVLRQLAMRAKIKAAEHWIGEFLKTDEKLLVFASHLEPLDQFAHRFKSPIIKGGVSPERRMDIVDDFQEPDGAQAVFLQIDAGGVGLTMTAASNVLFIEQAWSPLTHDQAIDRCYGRLNDMHGAVGWYLIAEGTIDEWISDLLAIKRIECDDALDGERTSEDIEGTSVYSGLVSMLTARSLAA